MDIPMIVKLCILALAAIIFGFLLGRKTAPTPNYGGDIVFERQADGHDKCIFKLEHEEDWMTQQKSIIFKVEHTTASPVVYAHAGTDDD